MGMQQGELAPDTLLMRIHDLERELEYWKNAARLAEVDTENAEVSLRVARRQITQLKAQLEQEVKSGEFEREIQHAFDYWREACNHPRSKLDVKRASAIRARLVAGHSLDDLKTAIDGAADSAYVDSRGVRHDDIELICRDEPMFDKFIKRRQANLERLKTQPQSLTRRLMDFDRTPIHDWGLDLYLFKCPVCRQGDQLFKPLQVGRKAVFCTTCEADGPAVAKALR